MNLHPTVNNCIFSFLSLVVGSQFCSQSGIVFFFMAALCNRAGHYIFALILLSSIFFFLSSPNLSGRRVDV